MNFTLQHKLPPYGMANDIHRAIVIGDIHLLEKSGDKSGGKVNADVENNRKKVKTLLA